jgi:hypothetical protein
LSAEEVRRYGRYLALETTDRHSLARLNPVSLRCQQNLGEFVPATLVVFEAFGSTQVFDRHNNNLLHFVRKLLHPALTALKSCTSFTNGLQTVAYRENSKFDVPWGIRRSLTN